MKIDWLLEGPMASAAPWQAWWVILVSLSFLLALVACRWSRERVSAELRRFQSRIAADLHDDIGPSLSQIAIMSELAGQGDTPESAVLQEIACVSRDVLQSLGEIVSALDTSQDPLHDLTERMRWFAGETLSAQGISLDFRASEPAAERRLGADARRQVLLIFKECMNNIARHADAAHAIIIWSGERDWIVLHIEDDGRGFDPQQVSRGYGLCNMDRRARLLGGTLETHSRPGGGTTLDLRIPIPVPGYRLDPRRLLREPILPGNPLDRVEELRMEASGSRATRAKRAFYRTVARLQAAVFYLQARASAVTTEKRLRSQAAGRPGEDHVETGYQNRNTRRINETCC
jgi:hypothetical protein